MKGRKYAVVAVFAIGMLAALPVGTTAQSHSPAASGGVSPGVLVTGTFTSNRGDATGGEQADVENGYRERGGEYTGRTQMSDPRLSGDVTAVFNADRFCDGICSQDTIRADVTWGTFEIANDGGTWVGTTVGTTDASADGRGVWYYELVGTGAYEGLSAILFETEQDGTNEVLWSGVIFPGDLPPER